MNNSIGSLYSDLIKERFIKDKLKRGEIPGIEEVNDAVSEVQEKYNNFNSPRLQKEQYHIEHEELSSASKMNHAFDLMKSDLSVCIKALLVQGNKITDTYDATFTKLEGFQRKLETLQSKISTLLFESKNSDRHEAVFYERFESKDMIDLVNSTVEIDEVSNAVSIRASTSNVIPLTVGSDSLQVVTPSNPAIINSLDLLGLEVGNLLSIDNNTWQHQITTKEPVAQIGLDLIIRVPSTAKEVNKIIVEPAGADIKTQVNLELAYSNDGLNWLYPNGERAKRLFKRTSFDFQFVKAGYWRLRLTKIGNDGFFGNTYVYNFGLKSLLFLGKEYEKIDRNDISIMYSKIITPNKLDKITAANFKVCEETPPLTSIKYELAPLDENEITLLNDQSLSVNDIKYYLVNMSDKDSFTLDMLKLLDEPMSNDIMVSHIYTYKDQGQYDYVLHKDITGYSKSDTVLLRNAGDNAEHSSIGKPKLIRSTPIGWASSGLFYSTYVFISNPNGELINLGSTEMIINGKSESGKIRLEPGLNLITSLNTYWKNIDLSTLPFNSEVKVDPLYPYNHKYLIEGIGETLYGVDTTQIIDDTQLIDIIDPDGVYRNRHSHWQVKMSERSFEKFESEQKSSLDVFSYKVDNTNQERIVVKSNNDDGLLDEETFSIITKVQNSNPIKGLIVKATLSTEDVKTTPVLTEYLLKFR